MKFSPTFRTEERVHLKDFAGHLSPALGREKVIFFFDDRRMRMKRLLLAYLPSVGIGINIL